MVKRVNSRAVDHEQLKPKLKIVKMRRETNEFMAEQDQNRVDLKTQEYSFRVIRDGETDLDLAIAEAKADAEAAKVGLE
ncbi:hypothetical protein HAX54_031529 [Datura stramonium]|uniref:Uncharacterized protein n=1 Tax=Datura stramonium TaxID=4076 RepID=A0ABS8RGQ2_DATST|nr:hypothetical protein [Datura stramonium]